MRGFKSEDEGRDDDHESVEIEGVECVGATPKAIRVRLPSGTQHWVPQSVITEMSEVYGAGHQGRLVVRKWFARKEGLT